MSDVLPRILDLVLFVVTVGWVGRRPTTAKTSAMIFIVAAVQIAFDSLAAASRGLNIHGLYVESLQATADAYVEAGVFSAGQLESIQPMLDTIAGCWLAIYVIQSAWLVFVALGLVWIFRRLFRRPSDWAPFSSIDLPIWTVGVLIVGILLWAVSNVTGSSIGSMMRLVGCNVLLIALIPVCVQGCAAYKGLMNRVNLPTAAQVVITIALLVFGLFLPVVCVIGIVDFWANVRKLPREA